MKLLVADAESWERSSKFWETAYNATKESFTEYVNTSKLRLKRLEDSITEERKEWAAKVKREKTRPGIGFFGGYGINGWTLGVGVVWKVM